MNNIGNRLRQAGMNIIRAIQRVMAGRYGHDRLNITLLVVGCVLIPGAKAPKLVTEEMVKTMKPGSVLVDVAIDQGGSIETIDRITTHADPYFVKNARSALASFASTSPSYLTLASLDLAE